MMPTSTIGQRNATFASPPVILYVAIDFELLLMAAKWINNFVESFTLA